MTDHFSGTADRRRTEIYRIRTLLVKTVSTCPAILRLTNLRRRSERATIDLDLADWINLPMCVHFCRTARYASELYAIVLLSVRPSVTLVVCRVVKLSAITCSIDNQLKVLSHQISPPRSDRISATLNIHAWYGKKFAIFVLCLAMSRTRHAVRCETLTGSRWPWMTSAAELSYLIQRI